MEIWTQKPDDTCLLWLSMYPPHPLLTLWGFSALQWDLPTPFGSGDVPLCLLWSSTFQVSVGKSQWFSTPSWMQDLTRKGCVSALSSESKYDSGTGWPSFKEAHGTWEQNESHTSIIRRPDNSLGCAGTEVLCKNVGPAELEPSDKVHVCFARVEVSPW